LVFEQWLKLQAVTAMTELVVSSVSHLEDV